jgi:DNA-binding transcriptional LysR family regulator
MGRVLSQLGLQAFRLTVLMGSVSAAATTISRSQPAVSRILKDLEKEVGFRLFDRVRGRLQPTAEGLLLFDEIQRSFIGLDRIASAATDIREGRRAHLSVAVMPALSGAVLPKIITRFSEQRPDTLVLFQEAVSAVVVQQVLTRECQLGFASLASVTLGLRLMRSYRAAGMCIMTAGHRLAVREQVSVSDLEGERLVNLSLSTRLGAQIAVVLDDPGIHRVESVETHLCSLSSALVREGGGLAIVDSITAANHVQAGGVARPFAAPVAMEFGIVCLDGTESSSVQAEFIDACDAALVAMPGVTRLSGGASNERIVSR